ncbi:hypothetical protein CFP56_039287 [Quercus suber]|uniref:Apple domain-containing protein n=1 Tax=Quercus suber TaxID=58331 RepID=A0AAW0J046_QUESU
MGKFVENSLNETVLTAGVNKCYGYDINGGCQSNCRFVAFHYRHENSTGCRFWTNISTFFPDDSSRSEHFCIILPKPSNSANPNNITSKASQSCMLTSNLSYEQYKFSKLYLTTEQVNCKRLLLKLNNSISNMKKVSNYHI